MVTILTTNYTRTFLMTNLVGTMNQAKIEGDVKMTFYSNG